MGSSLRHANTPVKNVSCRPAIVECNTRHQPVVDSGRLFLAPELFDELLLVQYLVSRSHLAGGLTLERRYTLPELWHRLRNSGYLRAVGVTANNPSDAFEQLLEYLSGGDASIRFYYVVDRRAFLETAKLLSTAKAKK